MCVGALTRSYSGMAPFTERFPKNLHYGHGCLFSSSSGRWSKTTPCRQPRDWRRVEPARSAVLENQAVLHVAERPFLVRFGKHSRLWVRKGIAIVKLDHYLQINEAAEFLGVCQNTLRNWGRTGKIKEYRHPVNNYRLYRQDDLEALLDSAQESLEKSRKPR